MTTLVLTRTVALSPAEASAAFTDPSRLAQWWWPSLPDTTYDIDARTGGYYRIASEVGGFGVHGSITELHPGERLVMTWCWEDGDDRGPIETVSIGFDPVDDGTLVTVTHPAEHPADFEPGWHAVLDRLVAWANG